MRAPSSALRPLLFIGSVLLALTCIVAISQWRAAHAVDLVSWQHDLAAAEAQAKTQHREVLAYFTASWCGPCQEMKRTTWSSGAVRDAIERRYVPVKIDIDEQHPLVEAYSVGAVPTFIVMSDQGQTLRRSSGYMDARQMEQWVEER